MMNRTKIEYLDMTWNPIVGCTGEDCTVRDVCWARAMGKRQFRDCAQCYVFHPHLHPERLTQPMHRKVHTVVGVCFMGDLYDRNVSVEWRRQVYNIIRLAHWHKFVGLTKHPDHVLHAGDDLSNLDNFWLGVTVNRGQDKWRIRWLQNLHVKHRWVSFEPLYGEVTNPPGSSYSGIPLGGMEGIVIGAQTRPELQPDNRWVTNLIEQALKQDVKVFIKNNVDCEVPFESDKVNQLPWRQLG